MPRTLGGTIPFGVKVSGSEVLMLRAMRCVGGDDPFACVESGRVRF